MRMLLTGGSGFVGKNLSNYFNAAGYINVIKPTRKDFSNLLNQIDTDYIVNLASNSSVAESFVNPESFIKANIDCMLKVLEYARITEPKLFIHFSTVEVYKPSNPYAVSKLMQEELLKVYARIYKLPAVILRSPNIVGPGQGDDKFIPKLVKKISAHEIVTIYGEAKHPGKRVYLPVQTAIDAVEFLIDNYEVDNPEKVRAYNINGGREMTNLKMAKLVAKILKSKLHYEYAEAPKERDIYAAEFKIRGKNLSSLGWRPPQSLQEGLAWIK
jgi:nucleoside-diphosphate-sugar epimerase